MTCRIHTRYSVFHIACASLVPSKSQRYPSCPDCWHRGQLDSHCASPESVQANGLPHRSHDPEFPQVASPSWLEDCVQCCWTIFVEGGLRLALRAAVYSPEAASEPWCVEGPGLVSAVAIRASAADALHDRCIDVRKVLVQKRTNVAAASSSSACPMTFSGLS